MMRRNTIARGALVGFGLPVLLMLPVAAAEAEPAAAEREDHVAVPMVSVVHPNQTLERQLLGSTGARTMSTWPTIEGILRSPSGEPAADASIRLDLEPDQSLASTVDQGVGVALIQLGSATTDARGRWVVSFPPLDDLRGYSSGGSASLLVSAAGAVELAYHVEVSAELLQVPTTLPESEFDGSTVTTGFELTAQRFDESSTAAFFPSDVCGGASTYYWVRSDVNIIRTMNRVQRIFTKDKTKWRYNWSTTNETRVDAAINMGTGGALVSGGFVAVQSQSAGVKFKAGNSKNFDAAVEFDNRAWDLWCRPITGSDWLSSTYEWRPFKFTGGNDKLSPKYSIFSCNAANKVSISSETWVARTTTYTYGVGAHLSTVDLRVRQSNSSGHKLTFVPSGTAHLCGSNDYPIDALQVREVS